MTKEENDMPRVEMVFGNPLATQNDIQLGHLERIQYCDLYVELQGWGDYYTVQSAVREVAVQLCDLSLLRHLRITFRVRKLGDPDLLGVMARLLGSLVLLRNMTRVDMSGNMPPAYAQYLKNVMEGNSGRDHLPKMYQASEKLVVPFPELQESLERAFTAMEASTIEWFKIIREKLVKEVVYRTTDSLNHLYDHDANPGEGWVWTIQRQDKHRF